jgi:hypothetical protein
MSLRESMPVTAAFIDRLREAFGAEAIDGSIRRGMKGEANCFHAAETIHSVGTPFEAGVAFRPRTPSNIVVLPVRKIKSTTKRKR